MDFSIIKEIRKIKGLSQQKLGEKLGVSGAYIQQIENNKKNPSMKTLQRISEALNVDIDLLINRIPSKIYTKNDVFTLYNKLNPKVKLSKFLGFPNEFCMEYEIFISGQSLDFELYRKLANFLNLSSEDLYNWYLSDVLCELLKWDDFGVNNLSYEDLKYILDNNILEKQSFESLKKNGLTDSNIVNLKNYLKNKSSIAIHKVSNIIDISNRSISKSNTSTISLAYESLVNLILYIGKEETLRIIDDKTYKNLLLKVCDLLEFEIYKIEKENQNNEKKE